LATIPNGRPEANESTTTDTTRREVMTASTPPEPPGGDAASGADVAPPDAVGVRESAMRLGSEPMPILTEQRHPPELPPRPHRLAP
jgi:hypothetical protein